MSNTEKLDYTVENIGMIFSYLKDSRIFANRKSYRIEVDGVEIVPLTKSLDPFSDFLNYSFPRSEKIVFSIFNADGSCWHKYEFDLASAYRAKREREKFLFEKKHMERKISSLKHGVQGLLRAGDQCMQTIASQQHEIPSLKSENERLRGQKGIEKTEDAKLVETGDCYVVFVPKKIVEQVAGMQIQISDAVRKIFEQVDGLFK